jgi:CRP-like cAMP-binding protein
MNGARTPVELVELFKSGRWFAGLSPAFQAELMAAGRLQGLGDGELVFRRGDEGRALFAIAEGAVRLMGSGESGRQSTLIIMEPPTWFGEIALFDDQPRTHDAVCEGPTTLLEIPKAQLFAVLDAEPRRWRDFSLLLTHQLRLVFAGIEELTFLPARARVARRLLSIAQGYGDRPERTLRVLDVRQEDLAAMLALSRQTTNQLLKALEQRGAIRLSYGQVEIVDFDVLNAEAEDTR